MNTVINIRTQKSVRDQAKKIFSKLGISTSAGINLFLHQVAIEKGLPFTPATNPKEIRRRWDNQANSALRRERYPDAKSALRGL